MTVTLHPLNSIFINYVTLDSLVNIHIENVD
jgi:hypothetical protein